MSGPNQSYGYVDDNGQSHAFDTMAQSKQSWEDNTAQGRAELASEIKAGTTFVDDNGQRQWSGNALQDWRKSTAAGQQQAAFLQYMAQGTEKLAAAPGRQSTILTGPAMNPTPNFNPTSIL